jgi:uncharacterized peroxidase-related enzyme
MAIISTPDLDEATPEVAAIYEHDLATWGSIQQHTRVVAMNPAAYRAWSALTAAISAELGFRRYELVTLAAAAGVRSEHCRLAHGAKTLAEIPEQQLVRIARDFRDAGLTDAEVEMMAFAERVSVDAASMTDEDSRRLREVGFTDVEIVNIALAAAARNFYSRAIQSLGVGVDVPTALSPELRDALVESL